MKNSIHAAFAVGLYLLGTGPLLAAPFDSGSNGSYGSINVSSDTELPMPAGGIFHCTTINVTAGRLTFTPNALNTPVYLLATGDVNIASGAAIDVSGENANGGSPGRGGPGGFTGGYGSLPGLPPGDGQGPGGGKYDGGGIAAVHAFSISDLNTNVYGNTLLSPLIGGSGGSAADARAGGGGGGAILIASSTKVTINGDLLSDGGTGCAAGSGGAIRVVAPVIDGSGRLLPRGRGGCDASGPSPGVGRYNGGEGRSRLDCIDRFSHRNVILQGKGTRGSQMFVFPPVVPTLHIVQAAGTDIPEGTPTPFPIALPVGSPTNQNVQVRARDFASNVLIMVTITPENGPSKAFPAEIINSGNPSFADVNVEIPPDVVCYIHAWTR